MTPGTLVPDISLLLLLYSLSRVTMKESRRVKYPILMYPVPYQALVYLATYPGPMYLILYGTDIWHCIWHWHIQHYCIWCLFGSGINVFSIIAGRLVQKVKTLCTSLPTLCILHNFCTSLCNIFAFALVFAPTFAPLAPTHLFHQSLHHFYILLYHPYEGSLNNAFLFPPPLCANSSNKFDYSIQGWGISHHLQVELPRKGCKGRSLKKVVGSHWVQTIQTSLTTACKVEVFLPSLCRTTT